MFQRQKKSREAPGRAQSTSNPGNPTDDPPTGDGQGWSPPASAASKRRAPRLGRETSGSRDTSRTTSYPQGMEGGAKRLGVGKTTSYPQPMQRSRRGYQQIV